MDPIIGMSGRTSPIQMNAKPKRLGRSNVYAPRQARLDYLEQVRMAARRDRKRTV